MGALRLAVLTALLAPGASVAAGLPPEAEGCLACHGNPAVAPKTELGAFAASAHGALSCAGCHPRAERVPHPERPAAVDCAACHASASASLEVSVHGKGGCASCHGPAHATLQAADSRSPVAARRQPKTCGRCHAEQRAAYEQSVHAEAVARGVAGAPSCSGCHGEHGRLGHGDPRVRVSSAAVVQTCASCHASEELVARMGLPADRLSTFAQSYHGLVQKDGALAAANCASCHGAHAVLPSGDARSSVHPANLMRTCGQCHPSAGRRLASGKVHDALAGTGRGSAVAGFFRSLYLLLIPLTVGGMLIHNAADFLQKALYGPLPPLREEEDELLSAVERLQHALLVASFAALAYSGFALDYPDRWWAAPLRALGGEEARRGVHRAAAAVFVLVGLGHAVYLGLSARGRARLSALLPKPRDLGDPFDLFLYNLGLHPSRPKLKRFSYIEKVEYWALLWGSFVMVGTGAVLLFHNFSLAYFPLWLVETARVVHFMEAALACLAIVIWHLYWVVYDPEVYPMNWAWLVGRLRLRARTAPGRKGER